MFMLSGSYGGHVEVVFNSLNEVCQNDPLFPESYKGKPCHDNGWGYVTIGPDSIDFKRYSTPIFESKTPNLGDSGKVIVHVRKAASGEPTSLLDAHPHHRGNEDYDVYLVHNGSYNKKNIAAKLNETKLDNQPDSEYFLEYLMQQEGNIEEKIERTLSDAEKFDFVKTTNNIFILSVDKTSKEARTFYHSSFKKESEYVTMYKVQGKEFSGVVSSSLLKSSQFPLDLEVTKVKTNKLYELS